MAYIINRYSGAQITAVEDGTIDQTTDLKFIGKNFSGYGEIQNENMMFLLENFAGTTSPSKAINGQVWYDSANEKLKYYTGITWKNAGGAEVSPSEPAGVNEGDLWWSTTNNQLYARSGNNEWILVGPQSAGTGTTQLLSIEIYGPGEVLKPVIIALVENEPAYIIADENFTPSTTQPAAAEDFDIPGNFSVIKKGITLKKSSTLGVSQVDTDGSTPYFWGTASDAARLGGVLATDYVTTTSSAFTSVVSFADDGLTLGDGNDLEISITGGTIAQIFNNKGTELRFGASSDGITTTRVADIVYSGTTQGIIPAADNTFTLGTSSLKWNNVHSTYFTGIATKADTLSVGGTYRSAATAATANTIAARDASGNLTATIFNGTATTARYADLAEKYTTAEEYPVGTAMAVAGEGSVDNPTAETRPANSSDFAIGVISAEPAYLMNNDCEGQAIGLKGRVPVRVKGVVKKGQPVYAWADGVCSTLATRALVGVALESNDNEEEKLVECVLKV